MGLREELDLYLLEDRNKELLQKDKETLFGEAIESPLFRQFEALEEEQIARAAQTREQKNVVWDTLGSGLWTAFDEAGFGLPGAALTKLGAEEFVEYMQPTTTAGKYAAGIGGAIGFIKGLPVKVGAKIAKKVASPFIKQAGYETGAKILSKAGKEATQKVTTAQGKQFAKNLKQRTHGIFEQPKIVHSIKGSKEFVVHARRNIDEFTGAQIAAGKIGKREGKAIAKAYKNSITKRPLNDFVDLFTRNTTNRLNRGLGYIAHEAVMFASIDAIHEGIHSVGYGEDYDPWAPLWGAGVGVGFGALKFTNFGGKQSSTYQDFIQGIKGFVGKDARASLSKASDKNVVIMSKILGEDLKRVGSSRTKVVVDYKGQSIEVDLSKWDNFGNNISIQGASLRGYGARRKVSKKAQAAILRKALNQKSREIGPEMVKWALKSEVEQLKNTFPVMLAGTTIMNARLFTEMASEEIAADDIVFNVLLGAFLNRKGVPREYDAGGRVMKSQLNNLRSQLSLLGVNTKNMFQNIPTFDPTGRDPIVNPVNNDPELSKIVKKMDEMGMADDILTDIPKRADPQSLANAKTSGGEDFALFEAFKRYYFATTKRRYVVTDDMINAADARSIQDMLKTLDKGKIVPVGKLSAKVRGLGRERKQIDLRAKKLGYKDIMDISEEIRLGNPVKENAQELYQQFTKHREELLKLTGNEASELSNKDFAVYEGFKQLPEKSETFLDYDLTNKVDRKNSIDLLEAYRTRGEKEAADYLVGKLKSEVKVLKDNDMLEIKELTALAKEIDVANKTKTIERYRQIGGIKDVSELYDYLDNATVGMYENFKDNIFNTQASIMEIIEGYKPGDKRSNNIGTIPETIAFNADLELHALAREGKLNWLTKDGRKLKGEDAVEELTDFEIAVNRINGASNVLFQAKHDGKSVSIIDINKVQQLYELVRGTEGKLNGEFGTVRDDYKFNFSDMDHILTQIANREIFTDTRKVDKLFDSTTEDWNLMYESLLNSKIIDNFAGETRIVDDITRIRFEGEKKEGAELNASTYAKDRKFLQGVQRLVRSFNKEGFTVNKLKQDEYITDENLHQLKDVFRTLGLGNKLNDMEFFDYWTRELSYRSMQHKLRNTNLTNRDITLIENLTFMKADDGYALGRYDGVKKGAPGFTLQKVKTLIEDNAYKEIVQTYNKMVEEIVKRSKGVVAPREEIIFTSENTLNALNQMMIDATIKAGRGSKEQLINFLKASETTNNLTDALFAAGERDSETASTVVKWLINAKIITPQLAKNGELTEVYNFDRFANENFQIKMLEKLARYDVNIGTIADLMSTARNRAEELINAGYDSGTDRSLTVNQFFNRYLKHDKGLISNKPTEQTKFLRDIVFDADMVFRGDKALTDLMSSMKFKPENINVAFMDAVRVVMSRKNQIEKPVLEYFVDRITASPASKKMNRTPFTEFMNELGVDWLLINPIGKDFDKRFNKYVLDESIDVFHAGSDKINAHSKKHLTEIKESFENLLKDYNKKAGNAALFDGIIPFRFGNSSQVFGIYKQHAEFITKKFIKMKERYYESASNSLKTRFDKMENGLKETSPGEFSLWHSSALRSLIGERMLKGDGYNKVLEYFELPAGSEHFANLNKRFSLFHPSSANRVDRVFVEGIKNYLKKNPIYDSKPLERYLNREEGKEINMALWNDKDFAKLMDDPFLLKEFKKKGVTWNEQLAKRQDESGYDSIVFISEDFRNYLNTVFGAKANEPNSVKPVISSLGKNVHFFGKTMFVYSPNVQRKVFASNSELDILATGSADKMNSIKGSIYSDKIINMDRATLMESPNLKNNMIPLPLESIGIIKVTDVNKPASLSPSLHNFSSNETNAKIYDGVYRTDVETAINRVSEIYGDPFLTKEVVKILTQGSDVQMEAISGSATDNMGTQLLWNQRQHAIMDVFGDATVMNLLKKRYLDPVIKPLSEYKSTDGDVYRYGGQAPIIQDLSLANYDLKPTIVKNGKILQYGQIMLPGNARTQPIEFPGKDLEVNVISDKTGRIIPAKDYFFKKYKDIGVSKEESQVIWDFIKSSDEPLGFLHDFVKRESKGEWQVGVATVRYPRTRPNDLMFLRVKDFLEKEFGEATIVNKFDVLNVMEGDYDSDVANFYWGVNRSMRKHIQKSAEKWVHTVDESSLRPSMPEVSLITGDASTNERHWDTYDANRRVVDKIGKGLVQRNLKLVNFMRDISKKEVTDIDGTPHTEHILYNRKLGDGEQHKLVVDWNVNAWHERTALEGQHLLDYVKGVDPSIFKSVDSYRWDYLFPSLEKSMSRDDFLDNTGRFSSSKAREYRVKGQDGQINKRIRIFRHLVKDKDGKWKEVELGDVDKESIKLLMRKHNRILSLGGEANINGRRKTPNYQETMDLSRDYFEFFNDKVIDKNIYRRVRDATKQDDKGNFVKVFAGAKTNELKKYFGLTNIEKYSYRNYVEKMQKEDKPYGPAAQKDLMPWFEHNIFDKTVIDNLKAVGSGEFGTPLERTMYRFYRDNPLESSANKEILSGDQYAKFLNLEQTLLGDRYVELEHMNQMMPTLLKTTKGATAQIKKLNWVMYSVSRNNRLSKAKKNNIIEGLKDQRTKWEQEIKLLIPKKYWKSRSGKDLPNIKMVHVGGEREQLRALNQFWLTEFITSEIELREGSTKKMLKDVYNLKKLYRGTWAQYFNNTGAEPYMDMTILNRRQQEMKMDPLNPIEIQQKIEVELTKLYNEYGPLAVWHFAAPTKVSSPSTEMVLGLFNGNVINMAATPTKRFGLAIKFLEKIANKRIENVRDIDADAETANTVLDMAARMYTTTHNYFHKNVNQIPQDDIAFYGTLNKFSPEMPYYLKSMYSKYTNLRFGKSEDMYNPFTLGQRNNGKMDFFRRLFTVSGQEATFEEYTGGLSKLSQLSMENEYMHPMKYAAIMRSIESKANEGMKMAFTSTVDVETGRQYPIPSSSFSNNPIYALLGGGRSTTYGYQINTNKIFSSYQKNMMKRLFDQANQFSETKSERWDNLMKETEIAGKNAEKDCRSK